MARQSGMVTISTNYEVKNKAPLDARMLVATKADLTTESNWTWGKMYQGMLVSVAQDPVAENNGLYILKDIGDGYGYLEASSWVKLFNEEEFEVFQDNLTQDLNNYVTQDQLEKYAKLVVGSLPDTGEEDTIYFVELDGNWEEYIWYNSQFIMIGSNAGDLTNYYTKEEIDIKLQEIEDKIPTSLAQLSNAETGFITAAVDNLFNYYTKNEIDNIVNQISTLTFSIVESLPEEGQPNIIYLVPNASSENQNEYDEYIWLNNNWEKIGNTNINLDNYVTIDYLNNILSQYITSTTFEDALTNKQDLLVSGINIKTINGHNILGSGNIEIQGGIENIPIATTDTLGGILATDSGENEDVSAYVDVEANGKAFVKIPSVDETSTADDVINLLNTSTLVLNGNAT